MKPITSVLQSMIVATLLFCASSCRKEDTLIESLDTPDNLATAKVSATGRQFTLLPDADGRLVIDNAINTYQPGDVLNLAGQFKAVLISNLNGNAKAPIIIQNLKDSVVSIGNPSWNGGGQPVACVLWNCHYIKLGGQSGQQSFIISGSTQAAREAYYDLQIGNKSDNIEICNLSIMNGGNGIVAKTDPVKGDRGTVHPNLIMQNLSIHDIDIMNTKNEGMYVGHTATYWDLTANVPYYGAPGSGATGHEYVQPAMWNNVKIYNCKVHETGLDGIQTAAINQLEIYDNEVYHWATQQNASHNGGILIGGRATNTKTHNNYVHDGWGELCQFYGSGEKGSSHFIYNNLFMNNESDGISVRGSANAIVWIGYNTIANTRGNNVRLNGYTGMKAAQFIYGNVLIAPRKGESTIYDKNYIYIEQGATLKEGDGVYKNKRYPTMAAAGAGNRKFQTPVGQTQIGAPGF
ncbi:right-handed parallel beta-helix repeat-containing protein [Chitinophaga pinensis]|uniref:Parallel beta-helix repeat protein n=1 Tax=Chitinophaga pinensis (strain ATCC 43595 / DSM 2588 / LMG 13176 / NBRC 15968 / NCIMB 11800 / UQM 2034) TaxID=485918 RepID=A0A979GVM4_CHIPD|nr:right-handed parallel beta-helix repeat-containing protein [Chitinophaga pinensis]ACU59975.1 parallel beta-helix repeat protein [Chitinophaga pinensis DSM 2588]